MHKMVYNSRTARLHSDNEEYGYYNNEEEKRVSKPEIIYFESDAEFEDWAVAPYATIKYIENGNIPYTSGDFSDEYKVAIEEGKHFVIKDEDSVVYKRKCVCKRVPVYVEGLPSYNRDVLVQLKVDNLEPYFNFKRKR